MATMPVDRGFVVTSHFGPRWGTTHYGTDFGKAGGSGGYPVYAVRAGRVTHSGPASGFGRWVVIDHPADTGGGTSVYGHIIPEVTVGTQVREGQRIGRIDPKRSTNGGVAPHLHLEWHRYAWAPPGPDRLDPMTTVLVDARWPGDTLQTASSPTMTAPSGTIFGVDVSEHQNGMSLRRAKEEGIDFAIIRLCDGTHRDKVFPSHLADAEQAGLLVATYWYLRAPSEGTTISQQVDVIDQQMGGRRDLGVWIDVESITPTGRKLLTEADVWAAKRELESRGYHVPGIYTGAWYWEHMPGGEPSMSGLGALWVSHYGPRNAHGPYRQIYRGDDDPAWRYPLGDRPPDLLQYGSNGVVAGRAVDVNAYRGTRDELAAIFHPDTTPEEGFMSALNPDEQRELLEKVRAIDAQLSGPRQEDLPEENRNPAGGRGWSQLGSNTRGQWLTVVDALAHFKQVITDLIARVEKIEEKH